MAEYIEREEIYKAVGDMTETFRVGESGAYYAAYRVDEMVGDLPAADVVEVVRCKDCIYHNMVSCPMHLSLEWTWDNEFCSYGERKKQ